jgi:prephenate dehydrogenase
VEQYQIADVVSSDLSQVASEADLVVFCVPIGAMGPIARELVRIIPPNAVITDVGSVKGPVVETLAPIFAQRGRFLGSHPMAGSERAGIEAAQADLFQDAVCILTPAADSEDAPAVRELAGFWELLGCRVRVLEPRVHDETVALISHLPHLMAAMMVNLVAATKPSALDYCGNGFRDTTRVASGPAPMWAEILLSNRDAVKTFTQEMIESLKEVVRLLDARDMGGVQELLKNANRQRDLLRK